ncbi:MAG: Arc family DNA-binding protein [Kiritimatiellia bacterium]|jgi:plasmid stability protein|nr:Arc family DNA-binding protein [Kiritimatiellia bacterium]
MSTITLKDVPEDVHEALKAQAKIHGRSLNKEATAALEASMHGVRVDSGGVLNHARAVRETTGVYLTQKDLMEFKNAGRK